MTLRRSLDPGRRLVLGATIAIAASPLLRAVPAARADTPPQLSEDDPAAKALKYHHDATAAPRTDKPDTPAAQQFCHNCRFIQSGSGEWRPCQIFPGKAVNANGWCTSWAAKPA